MVKPMSWRERGVADIYEQPVPPSAVSEPDGGGSVHSRLGTFDGPEAGEGALVEPHNLEGNPELNAWVDGGSDGDEVAHHAVAGGEGRVDPDIGDPGGASAPATDAQTPLPSRRPPEDSTPTSNPALPDSVFETPRPAPTTSDSASPPAQRDGTSSQGVTLTLIRHAARMRGNATTFSGTMTS